MTWLRHLSLACAATVVGMVAGGGAAVAAAPEDPVLPPEVIDLLHGPPAADRAGVAAERVHPKARARTLEPGQQRGGSVVKTGWWSVANEPPPDTGVVAAPQPPAPNVPAGALPVGAALGDPEKLSALEFALDAEPGSDITSFKLVLREADEPGAALGASEAVVVACPVTELFWADGTNAAWKNRPIHDCDLGQAPGVRSENGTWSFDLSAIAADWADPEFTGSRSVVLVEQVDAPSSFEVSFDGVKAEGIGLRVKSRPGSDTGSGTDPDADGAGDGGAGDGGAGVGSSGGSGGVGLSGGDSSGGSLGGSTGGDLSGGSLGGAPGAGDVATGADEAPGTDPVAEATEQPAIAPVAAPTWYSGLPGGTFLLVPFALGLAYLIMLALGPDGRPTTTTQRHGVSRALDRLRQTRRAGGETTA